MTKQPSGSPAGGEGPAESAGDGRKVVNWNIALQCVNGDRQLLRDIAEAFLDESPRLLTEMRRAIASSDSRALRRAAHSLKGSTGYFGSARASQMAARLQSMAERGELTGAADELAAVEPEVAKLARILVDYLAGRIDPSK
ncbi:MAG: Hpt domain-containing protein [Planctomycetes bacterium]|nr:Hpt domain-containing protein [Planctomycetota bacterium]